MARAAGFCAFAEAMRFTLLSGNAAQTLLAVQPWHAWAVGYCVLTALFAQNYGGCWAHGWLDGWAATWHVTD